MSEYDFGGLEWLALASAAFMVLVAGLLWRHRQTPGAVPLTIQAVLIGVLFLAIAGETAATSADARLTLFLVRDALVLPSGVVIFWFALEYASFRRYLSRRLIFVLVGSVLVRLVLYLPDGGRLLWLGLRADGEVRGELAPLGVFFAAYAFLMFALATLILVVLFVRSPAHRPPVALILTGHIVARVVYPLAVLKIAELPNVANVLALDFAAFMYVIALTRFRLFDLIPVAHQAIIERMADAILVVDTRGRIADLNHAARRLLGVGNGAAGRTAIADALSASPALVARLSARNPESSEVTLDTPDGERCAQVTTIELSDWQGVSIGRLVQIHDISDLRAAESRLLEQERALAAGAERERLARDLHDSFGQVLAYVGLQAAAIRKFVQDGRHDEVQERLDRVAAIAADAQSDVRRTIADLGRSTPQDMNFVALLHSRIDAAQRDYGIEASVTIAPDVSSADIPPPSAAHLLRIVDEAITNAVRHGKAHDMRVALDSDAAKLTLSIADDGVGFEARRDAGHEDGRYGLRFMRERAAELGGTLEIQSSPGHGTRVMVRLPIAADARVVPT